MFADLLFCSRNIAERENFYGNIMVINLVTIMITNLVTHIRTDLGGRDRLQRNDGTEQIPFDELRLSARIQLGIFIGVAHTGAEFVGKRYLTEHLCNRWVFGKRSELRRIQHSPAARAVAVHGGYGTAADLLSGTYRRRSVSAKDQSDLMTNKAAGFFGLLPCSLHYSKKLNLAASFHFAVVGTALRLLAVQILNQLANRCDRITISAEDNYIVLVKTIQAFPGTPYCL